ncbi:hypothetical protein QJS10_CPA06g02033 [Acorus calamus]|uniref:DUF4283 domain-containing protein n=1 Tax=Acorus calamus TaxID=4465 RepID=A0AAV9EK33_ACOCL|nr:hypothetical protein QJS10_CPA06g02033 [Acorus calamus]
MGATEEKMRTDKDITYEDGCFKHMQDKSNQQGGKVSPLNECFQAHPKEVPVGAASGPPKKVDDQKSKRSRISTPPEDGTHSVVILEVEEVAETEVAWGLSLTGYVLGKYPVYTPFLQFLKRLWRPPKGEIMLTLQGNGFFIVRFNLDSRGGSLHALEDGPCSMDNWPFII